MDTPSTGNTFGDKGEYNAQGSNEFDSLNGTPPIEVSGDWKQIPDLKGFKAGDTAMLHVKVKLGAVPGDDGDASEPGSDSGEGADNIEVLSVKADPMEDGAKAMRGRMVDQSAPDLLTSGEDQ